VHGHDRDSGGQGPDRARVEIAVGDWVALDTDSAPEGASRVAAVLPRRCALRRAADARSAVQQIVAANIDTVLLCDALDGSLSLRHLERFLALPGRAAPPPSC